METQVKPAAAPLVEPLPAAEWPLERQCEWIADCWRSQWGAIQMGLLRELGGQELAEFKERILRRHQRGHFLEGLTKLGISRDLPPAVIAGRYHYLSNMLGGLSMEYIEESPKRVWVRYHAPSWSFTGLSLIAVPSIVQRAMFAGWHPHNGVSLGCPQLGFVVTKVFQDGEPYDEGYFEEFDQPLLPEDRVQYRPVTRSPDFDPDRAPKLDPKVWPKDRLSRAFRSFSRGYMDDAIKTCLERYGVHATARYVGHSLRLFAVQFFAEYKQKLGVTGTKARDLAQFFAYLAEMAGEEFAVERDASGALRVTRSNRLLVGEDVPVEIYDALFQFPKTCAKVLSARVRIVMESLTVDRDKGARETWLIEDTKDRLY
jgi:hypothetical protein